MLTHSVILLLHLALPTSESCDGAIPPQGRCEGARRVVWCESGKTHALDCTGGAVCAWNEGIYAFDCVTATCQHDVDDDGDDDPIPPTGRCMGDRVVWCDGGTLRELECKGGSSCGWNDKLGAHDCVTDATYAEGDANEDVESVEDDDTADAGVIPSGSGDTAVKPVSYEDVAAPSATPTPAASAGGCEYAGRPSTSWLVAALTATWLMVWRRRAPRLPR